MIFSCPHRRHSVSVSYDRKDLTSQGLGPCRGKRGVTWCGGPCICHHGESSWSSSFTLGCSSQKLQSFILIFGQSSVPSAPPPGSPPGWQAGLLLLPAAGSQLLLLMPPFGLRQSGHQQQQQPGRLGGFQEAGAPGSELGWSALNAICIAIGEPSLQYRPLLF